MNISIWQQFSSNHSSAFTVIGTFESHESAQEVARELRTILQRIVDWYGEPLNEGIAREVLDDPKHPPVPPELDLAEQYHIDWPKAVDWLANVHDVTGAVSVYNDAVFLRSLAETDDGEIPFDQIMNRFTDHVVVQVEAAQSIEIVLTCVAPNHDIANHIYQSIHDYLQAPHERVIPWINFHPKNIEQRDLVHLASLYLVNRDHLRSRPKPVHEPDLSSELLAALLAGNTSRVEMLRDQIRTHKKASGLTQPEEDLILAANADLYSQGEIDLVGLRVSLRIWLGQPAQGLPVLIAYLSAQGCSQIQYQFLQK
jgi:hypothetical protein